MYGRAWTLISLAMSRSAALCEDSSSPTMSSTRKKTESIASSMMILVDLDGAMLTDADHQEAPPQKEFPRAITRRPPSVRGQRAGYLIPYMRH